MLMRSRRSGPGGGVWRWVAVGLVTATTVLNPGSRTIVTATVAPQGASTTGEPFDSRATAPGLAPTATQQQALLALAQEQGDVQVRWNRTFGTPATIVRPGFSLTGPAAGSPQDVARAWLAAHSALFGWTAETASLLRVEKVLQQPANGPRVVLLAQPFGQFPGGSFGGSIVVGLDAQNRILLVRANAVRVPALADAPVRLSAADALAVVSGVAAPPSLGPVVNWMRFDRGEFAAPHYVRSAAFPVGNGPARPAWEVIFARRLDEGYRAIVDAETGQQLYRRQIVLYDGSGRVFRNYPGAPQGGTHDLVAFNADPGASPAGWLSLTEGASMPTTLGNNASTATNWAVYIAPDGAGQLRPVSDANFKFDYAFSDAWRASVCGANPVSTDGGFPDTPTYGLDALPAAVNLFFHHNVFHDYFWRLGFDSAAGAMQANNFGGAGEPGDPLIGLVQAGAAAGDAPFYLGRDNAYMFPMPDGIPSWSGMFLFEPIRPPAGAFVAPCVDGDFDAGVIYHEYTHGVTSRWVGGEFGNLDTFQGGSMGEAWSDFYALHYLFENGLESSDVLGTYVTGNAARGIRNWAVGDVPVGFGDLGYDIFGEEVHADGEIWSATLWDLRSAPLTGGPALAAQLIADGMPIAGPLPTMLDARDGILAADFTRTGGANRDAIWTVFARRGMGVSASAVDANDTNPKPGFDHFDAARNSTLAGRLIDARTGRRIAGARVIVGEYEARVSPVVKTAADGTFAFNLLSGSWKLTFQAPGYGAQTIDVTLMPGRNGATYKLHPNVASTAAGARVVQVSNSSTLGGAHLALSDTEGNTWRTDPDGDPTNESFVVDLAGDRPVTIRSLQVSAFVAAGNRFEALRDYQVLASTDGVAFVPIASGTFPTDDPRPVTPQLHYKRIDLRKGVSATHLKFVALSPQDAAAERVQVAEVQAFTGSRVEVEAGGLPPDAAIHDEGTVIVGTLDAQLTLNTMTAGACTFPPLTQGIDAWVTQLPDSYADGLHLIAVGPEQLNRFDPRPDVDVYFLSSGCDIVGSAASPSASESGTIPQGTKYVVSLLYTTAAVRIIVDGRPPE